MQRKGKGVATLDDDSDRTVTEVGRAGGHLHSGYAIGDAYCETGKSLSVGGFGVIVSTLDSNASFIFLKGRLTMTVVIFMLSFLRTGRAEQVPRAAEAAAGPR